MSALVFGLSAQFYPRQWCRPANPDPSVPHIVRVEDLPKEAMVKLRRRDGNLLLILSRGHPWLREEHEAHLKIHVEALGGTWSAEDVSRIRQILEPMIPHELAGEVMEEDGTLCLNCKAKKEQDYCWFCNRCNLVKEEAYRECREVGITNFSDVVLKRDKALEAARKDQRVRRP